MVGDAWQGAHARGVGEHKGVLPLVAAGSDGPCVGQLDEYLVKALPQVHGCYGACGEVFVGKAGGVVVLHYVGIGLLPPGGRYKPAIEPKL